MNLKRSDALRLMTKLAAFFPGVPEATVLAFAGMVEDYVAEAMEVAVDQLIQDCDRFPSMARLLDEYRLAIEELRASPSRISLPPKEPTPEELTAGEAAMARYWETHPKPAKWDPRAEALRQLAEMAAKKIPPETKTAEDAAEVERRWPGGVPQAHIPIKAKNGPACGSCGKPTVHNDGDLWFCREDGWVTRRTA